MPEPPRRARFQIHLSTAIVLMFVAGGLIWANVTGRRVEKIGSGLVKYKGLDEEMTESEFRISQLDYWVGERVVERGWPFDAMQFRSFGSIDHNGNMRHSPEVLPGEWRTGPIIYNALVALAILFAVWFLCEWLICRRAARKGA